MSRRQPTLKQLEYFACVAESLNFRQAAASLGISQPSLTAQIAALEERLSLTLLERSRSGTLLSPQGKALLEPVRQVLAASESLSQVADTILHGPAMTFRIGVPPTLGPYLLPFILPGLHEDYVDLKLYVREAAPSELEAGLLNGSLDFILSPLPIVAPELSVDPLFTEPLKLVVPGDHPLAAQKSVKPDDIFRQKVLTLEEHHHFHRQVQQICERYGAILQRDFEGTSLDTLRQMVVMGLGIAFLPGLYVHSELHNPKALHVCEFADVSLFRTHALVWRNYSTNRQFFRNLAEYIRNIVEKELGDVLGPVNTQQRLNNS